MTQLFRRHAASRPKEVWSSEVRWSIQMDVDNRGNATYLHAICTYGKGDDPVVGYWHTDLGPFDDLDQRLNEAMVESALRCSQQLTLFDRP